MAPDQMHFRAGDVVCNWKVLSIVQSPEHWLMKRHRTYKCQCTNCQIIILRTTQYLKKPQCRNCFLMPKGQAGINRLLSVYRKNAAGANRGFTLTLAEFVVLTSSPCFYCGTQPMKVSTCNKHHPGKKSTWGDYPFNGIDRVDNQVGYVVENCIPCCAFCNIARNSTPFEEFLAYWKQVKERFIREAASSHHEPPFA